MSVQRGDFRRGIIMPTLISQLKSILEQYPDDGQILKEIIQNAEDAEATKVVFLLDHESYGKDPNKLHHPDLNKYQGSALYAYNDAVFTERDWEGIRRLHDSIKADDPLKVGKFGLGFKSVFHLTDLPSIYSGHAIGFLDPHKRFFEVPVQGQSQLERTSSYNWDFQVEEDAKDIEKLSHQFQPFIQNIFGVTEECIKSGNFNGTMFRFPLRNKEMYSDLSTNCYNGEKVRQLLKSLETEGNAIFLFLKNIKHIEFYEKMSGTTTKLLEIKVPSKFICPVKEGRQKLSNHIKANANEWYKKESLTVNYSLQTEVIDGNGTNKSTPWIVTQHFGGRTSEPTTEQSIDGYLPLVGIASKHFKDASSIDPDLNEPYGQIFCFMPLPPEEKSPTGFYFHVHGSFAVDQNRRHLKWVSADQDPSKITDKDLLWNNFLIEKLLPVCLKEHYLYLIKEHKMLINKNESSEFLQKCALNVYSVLPNETIVNHHWRNFITSFKKIIIQSLEFFSITTLTWQPSMPYILSSVHDELTDLLKRILLEDKSPLACFPEHLLEIVPSSLSNPLFAEHVRKSYKNIQKSSSCSENEKITLLKYFIECLRNIKTLKGIQLLPLADNTWTIFENSASTNKIFVSNEGFNHEVFPTFMNKFVCLSKLPKQSYKPFIGRFNLHQLDRNTFVDMLNAMLGEFVNDEVVLSSVNWFTYEWLQKIWKCLHQHFKDDLDCFIGLHLLLVTDNKVVKLTQQPTIIGTSVSETNINKTYIQICNKLGIKIIETHRNEVYNHPCLWGKSILSPRLKNMLKFLQQINTNGFETFTNSENDYFVKCLTSEIMLEQLTATEINILRNCKIFKTIEGSAKQNSMLVSLNEVNVAMDSNLNQVPPVPPFIKLLDLSNESKRKLAKALSVKLLNYSCLIDEAFIPGIKHNFYNSEELKLLMKYICSHFNDVSERTQKILSEISFITKFDKKTLVKPRDLFDHEDNNLKHILEENDFPGEEWRNHDFHWALIKLGLKTSDFITRDDCLKIINKLSKTSTDCPSYNKFLQFLNRRNDLLDEFLKNQIKHINWIRFKKFKPHGYPNGLKYYGEVVQGLATIEDVVSSKFEKILGSTYLLVDCKHLHVLEMFFGWDKCPHLNFIVNHLKNIITYTKPSENIQIPDILKEIYSRLNQYSESELRMALNEDFPWVWNGKGFSVSKSMVKCCQAINTEPYTHVLPVAFKDFDILWQSLYIPLEVNFIQILALIKNYHEMTKNVDAGRMNHDLDLAIRILNHLAGKDRSNELDQIIYVPINTKNSNLQMKALEDCVYCDKSWYKNGFDIEDIDDNIHLIHDKIPMKTAENLNISSCLSKLLNVEEIQSWGQEESITTRLRGLLKDYTDGLSVLKELIQNADDAGATEVSFVFDERTNEGCKNILLSENMKDLQGPAIWCHNNAMFTDEDFRNITKLGGATKEHMNTKIGKFGLGFNSVYNLTEVPIFVSGDYVVFFDPHAKYLGKALVNKNSPGIRLKLPGNQKISRLTDQFAPFNGMFGCNFSSSIKTQMYEGTLFRFPLRTKSQALSSEICKKHYSKNEVIQLFECLIKAGADLFLFAQNLVKINIYRVDESSSGLHMSEVYSITREIKEVIQNVPRAIDFSYLSAVSKLITVETSNGFVLQVKTKETFKDAEYFNIESEESKCDIWYVSWCSGVGRSYQLYLQNPTFLPIGAVAVKLELSENDILKLQETEGKMFCFMPLSSKSFLPFHVNGYFALNSSRTHMYTRIENDKTDRRWIWNEALLTDGVTSAYCNLLLHLPKHPHLNLYHIFPNISSWQGNCLVVESIYNKLINTNLSVFKSIVDGQMYSFSNCRIIGLDLQGKGFYQAIENSLISMSSLYGIALLKLPQDIYSCFIKLDDTIKFLSKVIDLVEFYKEWFLPDMSIISIEIREEIIIETVIDNHLNKFIIGHACIPVTPNGESLKYINELVHPTSKIAKLFDNEDRMFPFVSNFMNERKNSYLQMLCSLGMRSDSLTKEEIIERCYSVEISPILMKERLPILLNLIESKLNYLNGRDSTNSDITNFVVKLENIKMFPFKLKPKDYPLLWKDPHSCLISCKDGYLENKMLIAAPYNVVIDEVQSFKGGYPSIKSCFGLNDKLLSFESLQVLVEELNKHFDEKNNYLLRDRNLENVIKSIVDEMHKEIDSMITHKKLDTDHKSKLSVLRFVSTNSQPCALLALNQCCKFIHKTLLPYMCGVHETSLNKWSSISQTIGIKEKFTVSEFVDLLNTIEKKYHGIKLDDSTLNLVIDILECISIEIKGQEKVPKEFFLPSKEQILCPSFQLKYNDCDWSELQSSEYCHDKISKSLARKLGLKTIREKCLSNSRLSYSFGQKEELVTRINRILSGYPMDESIFKDMIQNADDAMASEIHFINDTRKLPDEKVFCDEWKQLQGPALCIYNNKSFTLDDLEGIQKLGEGSKLNDITKTGQYGVGFNCVYHLTDAPSFMTTIKSNDECKRYSEISGTVLAVFDPNCHFLPDSDSSNPGALYKSEVITEMFPDVYNGYLHNFEKYNVNKSGTMFRLPLRNDISRHKSRIKGSVVSTDKVQILLKEMFSHESHLFLLFLKSLESIQVVEVAYDSSERVVSEVIQDLHLHLNVDAKARKNKFMEYTNELSKSLQSKDILLQEISSQEILYEIKIEDSNNKVSNWIIVHRFGFKDTSVISYKILEAYNGDLINLQPYGGIAFQIDNFYSEKKNDGRIFTFLPLARSSELPVHLNGHFFLNHENRRDLWFDDKKTFRTEWNEAVMSQIIVPAYCSLLRYVKEREMVVKNPKDFHKSLLHFYQLFPGELTEPLVVIRKEFYKHVYVNKLELFLLFNPNHEDVAKWTNVDEQVYFDDLNYQLLTRYKFSSFISNMDMEKAKILRETLYSCGLKIVVGPIDLWNNFQKIGMENIKKITPENVRIHLSSSPLFDGLPKKLEETPLNSVENVVAVLEYISKDMVDASQLKNLPLLLSSSNILHKVSNKLMLFESKHCNIAPHKLNQFIHPSVEHFFPKESKIIKKLTIPDFTDLVRDFDPLYHLRDDRKLFQFACQHFGQSRECLEWLKAVWKFINDVFKESNDLKPIQYMSITPVKINNDDYLYPLHKMLCVLKPLEQSDQSSNTLFESLLAVGIPILNIKLINLSCVKKEVLDLFGDIHNPLHVLKVLEDIYINLESKTIPTKDQGLEILRYFSRNTAVKQNCSNACNILKSLPFYIDMNNQQIACKSAMAFIIPQNIPPFDTKFLPESHVFLKDDFDLRNLFEFIKSKYLTESEVYIKFLFDAFQHFNKESQTVHLKRIRNIAYFNNDKHFIQRLQDFSFIEHNGQLRRASYFYDKKVKLFALMEERFIPEPFDSNDWYTFLKKCGLITKLSKEIFLGYASKLPSLNVDTSKMQYLLIECLINNYELEGDWMEDNFLNQVKVIPFLYPSTIDKNLLELCPEYCRREYISLSNSVLVKDTRLCWTVSNIIPSKISSLICKPNLLKRLSVRTELDSNLVCENLANISHGFERLYSSCRQLNEKMKTLIRNLTDEHLLWLGSNRLDQKSMETLKDIKCLYIDKIHMLVQPKQVATDICSTDQIFPYIVKLPSFYGKHESLLLQLGATKSVTVGQCAWSLEKIKYKLGDQKMDPNMTSIVKKLFEKLLELAKQNISNFNDLKRLFLPCAAGTLHDSTAIYCTNKHKRGEGVYNNLDFSIIIIDDVELLLKLPEPIRPKCLDNFLQVKLFSLGEDISVPVVNDLQKKINHQNFLGGLVRINNHYASLSMNKSQEQLKSEFEYLSEKLKKIEFCGKESITIQFLLDGKILENTREQKEYFIEHDHNNDKLSVYISPIVVIPLFFFDLSKELANYFNIPPASSVIKEILQADSCYIDDILEKMEVKTYSSMFEIPLGNEIPIEDHFSLVQDVHIYYPKQLVAYEVDDPLDREEEGEPKYILVEIIRVQNNDNNLSRFGRKYEVNFGSHQEVICATRLYAFETRMGTSNVILLSNSDFGTENVVVKTSATLSEIIDELKSVLKEIWDLPEVERKKALKRLYLKYHPDKNSDNSQLFNEVFKHLTILIERLERGLSIDDYNRKTFDKQDNQSTFTESRDWNNSYFERMNRRAKQHSYAKQKKGNNFQNTYGSSKRTYRNFFTNFSRKRNNDPKKAELWMKQAQHDAKAALNDYNFEFKSAQWRCIKYYQAIKNGITAVFYSKNSNQMPSPFGTLTNFCSEIYDEHLEFLVEKVDKLLISIDFLTQPNSSKTAFEEITDSTANDVSELVMQILCRCSELVRVYNNY